MANLRDIFDGSDPCLFLWKWYDIDMRRHRYCFSIKFPVWSIQKKHSIAHLPLIDILLLCQCFIYLYWAWGRKAENVARAFIRPQEIMYKLDLKFSCDAFNIVSIFFHNYALLRWPSWNVLVLDNAKTGSQNIHHNSDSATGFLSLWSCKR